MNTMEIQYQLQPGDVVVRNKSAFGLIDHYGIYVGSGMVIDNHPDRGVSQKSLRQFMNGRSLVRIKRYSGNEYQRNLVVQKAYSLTNQRYHLTEFNCEHFVNEVWGAGRKSEQVSAFAALFFLALFGL